jgi:hypothetical protein
MIIDRLNNKLYKASQINQMETRPFEVLFGDPQLKTLRQSVGKKIFAKCLLNYVADL